MAPCLAREGPPEGQERVTVPAGACLPAFLAGTRQPDNPTAAYLFLPRQAVRIRELAGQALSGGCRVPTRQRPRASTARNLAGRVGAGLPCRVVGSVGQV